ncbi:MAG: hypothetical protein M1826_005131 [Phylliscum demangeonii]|nr:MAG: hypothetical protein M1826_005131 [Phylliscum demangeonii]
MSDDEYSNIDSFLFRPFATQKCLVEGVLPLLPLLLWPWGGDRAEPTTAATTTTTSPPHSRGKFESLPLVVAPHYCTRCAKRLAVEPELVCKQRVGLKRCERCTHLSGRCKKIPTKYQPRVEALQLAVSAVVLSSAGCRAAAQAALNAQVREYTARVEGFVHHVGRGPPPGTYTAAERETHHLLRAIIRGQRRIEASYRSEYKLPMFESDDEADVDDEKEAALKVPTGKDAGGDEANGDDGGDEDEAAGKE